MTDKELAAVRKMANKQTKAHLEGMVRTFTELRMPRKDIQENVDLFWKNEARKKGMIT